MSTATTDGTRGRCSAARIAVGFAAVYAVPALLWIDTLVAWARGWRPLPYWRLVPSIYTGPFTYLLLIALPGLLLAAVTLGPWLALLRRSGAAAYGRRAPQLVVASVAFVGAVLVADLVTDREFDRWTAFHRRPPNSDLLFRAAPGVLAGVHGEAHYRTNSMGVRGPELPVDRKAYRILCVGGSTTECVYLDDAKTWPQRLMRALNASGPARTWVGNVGISGYTTAEHLEFLERSPLLDQIDCALFLVGFNDGGRVIIGASESGPPPLWRRSALVLFAYETVRRRIEYRALDRIDEFAENIRLNRLRRKAAPKTAVVPDLGAARAEYAERLRRIVRVCRARGVRPVFITQPVLYDRQLPDDVDSRLWLGEVADGRFVDAATLRSGMEAYNDTLRQVCRELHVDCVELSDMSGRPEFFFDDCHFSEAGAGEVAARLATYFRASGRP